MKLHLSEVGVSVPKVLSLPSLPTIHRFRTETHIVAFVSMTTFLGGRKPIPLEEQATKSKI